MTETELLIHETIIYLLEIRKDYSKNTSMDDVGKVRTLTNAVELLHQYLGLMQIRKEQSNIMTTKKLRQMVEELENELGEVPFYSDGKYSPEFEEWLRGDKNNEKQ